MNKKPVLFAVTMLALPLLSGCGSMGSILGGPDAAAHLQEARFPGLAFPAMRGVGVDAERSVAVADLDEHVEVVSRAGGGAGMDFVAQLQAQAVGMLAQLGRLLDEALLTFLDQIKAGTTPEAPRVTTGQLPSKGHAPEHGHGLHAKIG